MLFCVLQTRNVPNPLLTAIVQECENKQMKVNLGATLTQPIAMNTGVPQGCRLHRRSLTDTYLRLWQNEKKRG